MDKFGSIRAFTQVVVSGGFAAAAREMGTSRPQVNKLVIALDNELVSRLTLFGLLRNLGEAW